MGNYKKPGNKKFIPQIAKDNFHNLIIKSKAFKDKEDDVRFLLDNCLEKMFSLVDDEKCLGFWPNVI